MLFWNIKLSLFLPRFPLSDSVVGELNIHSRKGRKTHRRENFTAQSLQPPHGEEFSSIFPFPPIFTLYVVSGVSVKKTFCSLKDILKILKLFSFYDIYVKIAKQKGAKNFPFLISHKIC